MSSVDIWTEGLRDTGLTDAEIAERSGVLAEFCAFASMTPDELVEECVDRERGRVVVKERKKVEELIDRFAGSGGDGDARAVAARANVIRSFLIHNGVRILTPRAPWL